MHVQVQQNPELEYEGEQLKLWQVEALLQLKVIFDNDFQHVLLVKYFSAMSPQSFPSQHNGLAPSQSFISKSERSQ